MIKNFTSMIIESFFCIFLFDGGKTEMITLPRISVYNISIKRKVIH